MYYNKNSESRLHFHAKQDVIKWIADGALGDEYKNCKALLEYQIINHPKGFTTEHTFRSLNISYKESPSYQECISMKYRPLRSIDIVLVKDGKVLLGIEIAHTNRCKQDKIRLLKVLGLKKLIEIDATWCSRQMATLTRPLQFDVLID
jgi:hypothetical protein